MTQDDSIDTRVDRIEQQLSVLQKDVTDIQVDVRVLKLTTASKVDLAQAKTSIIMWVVSTVFLAQLIPALLRGFS